MKGNIEDRACQLAYYIIENKATVRATAERFGISKSTVHTVIPNQNGFLWWCGSEDEPTKPVTTLEKAPDF